MGTLACLAGGLVPTSRGYGYVGTNVSCVVPMREDGMRGSVSLCRAGDLRGQVTASLSLTNSTLGIDSPLPVGTTQPPFVPTYPYPRRRSSVVWVRPEMPLPLLGTPAPTTTILPPPVTPETGSSSPRRLAPWRQSSTPLVLVLTTTYAQGLANQLTQTLPCPLIPVLRLPSRQPTGGGQISQGRR